MPSLRMYLLVQRLGAADALPPTVRRIPHSRTDRGPRADAGGRVIEGDAEHRSEADA